MKSLVVYFSRAGENSVNGNIEVIEKGYTEIVAEKIAKITGAGLYKLEPLEPYPFKYDECVKRARNEVSVPFIKKLENLNEYDTIYLGFPNWWRTFPRIVKTFLDSYDFHGKRILPFCTNEEGAFGIGELELRSSVYGAIIKQGFAVKGSSANVCDDALNAWIERSK